ncbi:MAG: type II toxin-antitoxin system Phd/YefM family antitoxin [Candidatus Melainabacteria bacterium]|nr:type II toxin-antitoxin system Phd/YefM family antitoxin [Candidatus Melainabacteria bacterium]
MEKRELNMSEVREKLADIIEDVKMKNESIIIEKYNKPQAAIVPYSEYEAFEEWEITKESELMKNLIKKDTGIRYNWEDVKKELFEDVPAKPFRRTKKISKKTKR